MPGPARLDHHIGPEAARLQVARVAVLAQFAGGPVKGSWKIHREPPQWGFLGEPRVNVLLLNVALDG